MNIYIYVEGDDLADIAEPLSKDIKAWLEQNDSKAQLVDQAAELSPEEKLSSNWKLGITILTKKPQDLKKPLDFLYGLAKTYKQNFVIGIFDEESATSEDVCYFGHNEGRPDVNEIANYLGL